MGGSKQSLPLAVRFSIWLHAACVLALVAVPTAWPWILAAVAGDHLVLANFVLRPRSRLLGANLVRLPEAGTRRGEVALTFDDGPDPIVTPLVLDLLDRYDAKASFFCIGRRAAAYPELVADILRRGHGVENHSHRHPYAFAFRGPRALLREVADAQRALGHAPRFFRAPMGLRSPFLHPILARTALRYVSWTRRGYDGTSGDADAVLRRLTNGLSAGDILLLHDGSCARTVAGEPVVLVVLAALLRLLATRDLRGVSLSMAVLGEADRLTDFAAATTIEADAPASPAAAEYASRSAACYRAGSRNATRRPPPPGDRGPVRAG